MQILKDEIKNAIVEAAVKEFALYGYENSSMRDIAHSAGISVSNTYHYYQSKEQLFSSLVEPVGEQVKTIFKTTLAQSADGGLYQNQIEVFVDNIVTALLGMDNRRRGLLLILAEKSAGTKYESFKKEIVSLLGKHLLEAAGKPGNASESAESRDYIFHIIAANYIDGLLKILKDYRSRKWAKANMKTLLTYHLNGIKALI
jgi:AcrR family transcriptional regulator